MISDIDDTIELTVLRPSAPGLAGQISHLIRMAASLIHDDRAFVGMPSLYLALATNGDQIHYVTGAYRPLARLPDKFLQTTGFPAGVVDERPLGLGNTENFKVERIGEIMRSHPEAQFILIGDNGQRDVESYRRLQADPQLRAQISAVYIHRLYPEGIGLALAPEQRPFLTAADLAVQLFLDEELTRAQLVQTLRLVDEGVASRFGFIQDRTFPRYASLTAQDLDQMRALNARLSDPGLQALFSGIVDSLSSLRKVLSESCAGALASNGSKEHP